MEGNLLRQIEVARSCQQFAIDTCSIFLVDLAIKHGWLESGPFMDAFPTESSMKRDRGFPASHGADDTRGVVFGGTTVFINQVSFSSEFDVKRA